MFEKGINEFKMTHRVNIKNKFSVFFSMARKKRLTISYLTIYVQEPLEKLFINYNRERLQTFLAFSLFFIHFCLSTSSFYHKKDKKN